MTYYVKVGDQKYAMVQNAAEDLGATSRGGGGDDVSQRNLNGRLRGPAGEQTTSMVATRACVML